MSVRLNPPNLRILRPPSIESRDSSSFFFTSSKSLRFSSSSLTSLACSHQPKWAIPVQNSSEGSLRELDDVESPASVPLAPISGESHFDRALADARRLQEPVVFVWMASWCRKCIYLKPKVEKLAADYYPRLRFYCVDVNAVPHKLVARAGVTKMPTVQLWKEGEKVGEVIGGHKAYMVVNEIREMIANQTAV